MGTSQNHQTPEVKYIFQKALITEFVCEHQVKNKTSQKPAFPSTSSSQSSDCLLQPLAPMRVESSSVQWGYTHFGKMCIFFFFLVLKVQPGDLEVNSEYVVI